MTKHELLNRLSDIVVGDLSDYERNEKMKAALVLCKELLLSLTGNSIPSRHEMARVLHDGVVAERQIEVLTRRIAEAQRRADAHIESKLNRGLVRHLSREKFGAEEELNRSSMLYQSLAYLPVPVPAALAKVREASGA